MTQDEIIEMARQAGWEMDNSLAFEPTVIWYLNQDQLETFAKLVAAKHDPKIAIADAYRAGVDSGIAAEREACAKVCEVIAKGYEERAARPEEHRDINPEVARIAVMTCGFVKAAIRARGNA